MKAIEKTPKTKTNKDGPGKHIDTFEETQENNKAQSFHTDQGVHPLISCVFLFDLRSLVHFLFVFGFSNAVHLLQLVAMQVYFLELLIDT